jgi:hypothetical protein
MTISYRRAPADDSESAYHVLVDEAVIGRIDRRRQLGMNAIKDFRLSGSDYTGSTRRASLWEASVEGAGLDEWDARAVTWRVSRAKTNRTAAAEHLIAAYRAAGVQLPRKQLAA